MIKDGQWLVFASDESRIVWESVIRRAWLPKGRKQLLRLNGKRQAQSFIGFLNLKTSEDLLYLLSWQKQDTIIPVLKPLSKNILINISASSGIMQDFTSEKRLKRNCQQPAGGFI